MSVANSVIGTLIHYKERERQYAFDFAADSKGGPYTARYEAPTTSIEFRVEDFDRYGLVFSEIRVWDLRHDYEDADRQSAWIDALTSNFTYLYGGFRCVENDPALLHAVLRTDVMTETNAYYEAVVSCGEDVAIRHFTARDGKRREQPVNMGIDVFSRIADEVAAIAQAEILETADPVA